MNRQAPATEWADIARAAVEREAQQELLRERMRRSCGMPLSRQSYRAALFRNGRVPGWCICGAPFELDLTERQHQERFERECQDRHHDGQPRLLLCDACMAKCRRSSV